MPSHGLFWCAHGKEEIQLWSLPFFIIYLKDPTNITSHEPNHLSKAPKRDLEWPSVSLVGTSYEDGVSPPKALCEPKIFTWCCVTNRHNPWVWPLRGISLLTTNYNEPFPQLWALQVKGSYSQDGTLLPSDKASILGFLCSRSSR